MKPTTYGATSGNSGATFAPKETSPVSHQNTGSAENVKREAAKQTESVKQQAAAKQAELKQQASEFTDAARQRAEQAAEQAKQSGTRYAHEKKARVAEEIGVFSGAIRKASNKLHEEEHDSIASYVDAAAEQLDRCRQSLERKEIGELIHDAQDFARRRPEIVYGGLFVAGLAAMRFLKASAPSSSHREPRSQRQDFDRDDLQRPSGSRSPRSTSSRPGIRPGTSASIVATKPTLNTHAPSAMPGPASTMGKPSVPGQTPASTPHHEASHRDATGQEETKLPNQEEKQ